MIQENVMKLNDIKLLNHLKKMMIQVVNIYPLEIGKIKIKMVNQLLFLKMMPIKRVQKVNIMSLKR